MKTIMKKIAAFMLSVIICLCAMPVNTVYAISNSQMASTVVSVAENEVGYESNGSQSKYGDWMGYKGSWCTYFALWCFNEAGNKLGVNLYGKVTPKGGNCNSMISWYNNKGRYHLSTSDYIPKPGDLVFFDWNGNGSSQHVGIVKGVSGSTVYTIEGNCSGKVKSRKYTNSGSKPYNNVSAIMGYGSIDWGLVTGNSDSVEVTTKKETTTKKQPAKTTTTTKPEKATKPIKDKSTTTTVPTTTTTTTTTTMAPVVLAQKITIEQTIDTISVGDAIKISYSVKPAGATAVVGYFCDQDDIVEIQDGGKIQAKAPGTATVVLCANDDIYEQYTINVVEQESVFMVNNENVYEITKPHYEQTFKDRLITLGVNIDALIVNKDLYVIPLAIVGFTLLVAGSIMLVKKICAIRENKDK